jgi:hypothetical protein
MTVSAGGPLPGGEGCVHKGEGRKGVAADMADV